jgi:hypothetical protein
MTAELRQRAADFAQRAANPFWSIALALRDQSPAEGVTDSTAPPGPVGRSVGVTCWSPMAAQPVTKSVESDM